MQAETITLLQKIWCAKGVLIKQTMGAYNYNNIITSPV